MCCWLENIKNINAHFKSLNYIHIYQGQLCADAQGQLLNLNDVQGTTPLYGCPHNSLYIPILWLNAHLCIRCPGPTPWEFPLSVCHWPMQFQGRYWLPQEWEVLGLHRLHHDLLKWGLLVPGTPPPPPPQIHFLPGQFPENDDNYPLPKLYMKLVNYWCWELNPRLLSCQASALTIMPLPLQLHKYAFMQMHVSFTQGVHKLSQVLTTEASQCCTQCKFRAVSVDFASMPRPTEQRCAWGIHIFCSLCSHSIWTSVSSNYAFRLSSAFFFPFPFSILNLSKDYSHIASYS